MYGETKLGNTDLVDYGIQNEESDLRIHVSPATKSIYVYDTINGVDAVVCDSANGNRKVKVRTQMKDEFGDPIVDRTGAPLKVVTAEGYLVPPHDIYGCHRIDIPDDVLNTANFRFHDSTTQKGNKAVVVVKKMLNRGLIPLTPDDVDEISDEEMQVSGVDISISSKAKIQVKCDWKAGPKEYGGTGNLFLQVSECNPLNQH